MKELFLIISKYIQSNFRIRNIDRKKYMSCGDLQRKFGCTFLKITLQFLLHGSFAQGRQWYNKLERISFGFFRNDFNGDIFCFFPIKFATFLRNNRCTTIFFGKIWKTEPVLLFFQWEGLVLALLGGRWTKQKKNLNFDPNVLLTLINTYVYMLSTSRSNIIRVPKKKLSSERKKKEVINLSEENKIWEKEKKSQRKNVSLKHWNKLPFSAPKSETK